MGFKSTLNGGGESGNSPDTRCCVYILSLTSGVNEPIRIVLFTIFRENINTSNYSRERDETVIWEHMAENLAKEKSDGMHHYYSDIHGNP